MLFMGNLSYMIGRFRSLCLCLSFPPSPSLSLRLSLLHFLFSSRGHINFSELSLSRHHQGHHYNIATVITIPIFINITTIDTVITITLIISITIITISLPPPVPPGPCTVARQLQHLQPPPSSTKRD